MRSLLLIIITMCLSLFAPGQTATIKGFLKSDGKPLAGATIVVDNAQMISDTAGLFEFQNIAYGKHLLKASMVGYKSISKNIEVKKDIEEIDLILEQAEEQLQEVVVTGTLKPVQRLQSPIAVEVYNANFFTKNPSPSLFESLQSINGVRPQINCNVCNTGDIHINGLEGPYTMVTIDGMPIISSLASVYGLFGIPSQMIEKVEVVKGPASGLYGSEAIGGLINVITKTPEKAP
jgi:outer membrane receptor for ferrienterochelin and colicins